VCERECVCECVHRMCVSVCIYIYTHTLYMHTYIYIHVCVCVCMCMCMCLKMCTRLYLFIHIYAYIYIMLCGFSRRAKNSSRSTCLLLVQVQMLPRKARKLSTCGTNKSSSDPPLVQRRPHSLQHQSVKSRPRVTIWFRASQ
jgi:hypothetical protein